MSLAILAVAAAAQLAIFALSRSVALLADLIHNFGDALTAIPLGIAFFLRSVRGERLAGLAVVLAIFVSACVALYVTIMRFIHPQHLTHLWVLAAAGLIGFAGNELAARVRLSAGRRLASAAMTADGKHARDRRVRLARRRRERDRGRSRRADRRPDHRPRRSPSSSSRSPGTPGTPSGTPRSTSNTSNKRTAKQTIRREHARPRFALSLTDTVLVEAVNDGVTTAA